MSFTMLSIFLPLRAKLRLLILLEACLVRRSHSSARPMRFWSRGTSGLGNVTEMYWARMPAWKDAVPRCQTLFSKMSYNGNATLRSATFYSSHLLLKKMKRCFLPWGQVSAIDKNRIVKPIDKSIIVDNHFLSDIDCIDQSIEIDSNNFFRRRRYRFYRL